MPDRSAPAVRHEQEERESSPRPPPVPTGLSQRAHLPASTIASHPCDAIWLAPIPPRSRQQEAMAARVVRRDGAPWLLQPGGWPAHLSLVAGLDISFFPAPGPAASPAGAQPTSAAGPAPAAPAGQCGEEGEAPPPAAAERAIAALAVLSFPELEVRHMQLSSPGPEASFPGLDMPSLGRSFLSGTGASSDALRLQVRHVELLLPG